MPFRVSGKSIDVGEALRSRVDARIAEAMSKYFDGGFSGHATICKEGIGFRTEFTIHLDSGITLQSEAIAGDAYASADVAAERIEKRLRRYKRRLKDRHAARLDGAVSRANFDAPSYVLAAPEHESDEQAEAYNPVVISETTTSLPRLSVRDAVMELDMIGAPVVVFRHAGHGRINIVYRRGDGNIGWIDPPATELRHEAEGGKQSH